MMVTRSLQKKGTDRYVRRATSGGNQRVAGGDKVVSPLFLQAPGISARKHLDRRTFLRGAGAALALPFLDSMTPAFAALSKPVRRLAVAYVPNGIIMGKWTPAAEGAAFDLPPILQPLAPFRDQLLVLSGLRSQPAFPEPGEGTGDHARAAATFLTGVHPKKTEGPDIRAGISMDQIAAQGIGERDAAFFA